MNPSVTVLMPVFNSELYLKDSLDSILNQTFGDFEFIIVYDNSTDNSLDILNSYSDPRIQIEKNTNKLGLVNSLNKGLKLARGKYIARMDADDISLPRRLERQVAFMDANPDIGVCGTWLETIGHNNEIWPLPTIHEDIIARMLFETHNLHHPTIMIRKDTILAFQEFYNEDFKHAEDAEYWMRLANLGVKFANIGEVFLKYRIHENNVSKVYQEIQKQNSDRILCIQLLHSGVEPTDETLITFNALRNGIPSGPDRLDQVSEFVDKILKANQTTGVFSEPALCRELARRWFRLCSNSANNGLSTWRKYHKKSLLPCINLTYQKKGKFFLKCLLGINRLQDILKIIRRSDT